MASPAHFRRSASFRIRIVFSSGDLKSAKARCDKALRRSCEPPGWCSGSADGYPATPHKHMLTVNPIPEQDLLDGLVVRFPGACWETPLSKP